MMSPAGALMVEHRLIERMIRLMREQVERIDEQQTCDSEFITAAVDFARRYADRCHHAKEEEILFRDLEARPLDEPLRQMVQELIDEHARVRDLLDRLGDANDRCQHGDTKALGEVRQRLEELTTLYAMHVETEDKRFFMPAQGYFSKQELSAMLGRFRDFDQQLLHQQYREVVGQWEEARHPT